MIKIRTNRPFCEKVLVGILKIQFYDKKGVNIMDSTIIIQQLEEKITNFLTPYKDEHLEELFNFEISSELVNNSIHSIEIHGFFRNTHNQDEQTRFILLRLFVNHDNHQVNIPNIFLPNFMRYRGTGKRLIYEIFKVVENNNYDLFIVDMTQSFYNKMLKRGAIPCDNCNDAVAIVSETRLV